MSHDQGGLQSTRPWAEQQQAQHRGLESKSLSSGEKTPRSTGHSFRAVPPDLLNPRYTSSLWHSPAAGTRGALPGFAKSSVMQSQSFTWGLMLTALLPSMPGVWLLPTLQSEKGLLLTVQCNSQGCSLLQDQVNENTKT